MVSDRCSLDKPSQFPTANMACPGDQNKMMAKTPEKPLLPISSTQPSYTILNRRRRVTCRKCQLPVGYVTLSLCEVDSWRSQVTRDAKQKRDDRLVGSICILNPINVGVKRRAHNSQDPSKKDRIAFDTDIIETTDGKYCEAEEMFCDGCETCLGARITEFEISSPDPSGKDDDEDCGYVPVREESLQWYTFSEDQIDIEPLMGLLNLDKLSTYYITGERAFFESRAIEECPETANNSEKWMHGFHRKRIETDHQSRNVNNNWPMLHLDMIRASDFPRGTIAYELGVEWAISNAKRAYSKEPAKKFLVDESYESSPC